MSKVTATNDGNSVKADNPLVCDKDVNRSMNLAPEDTLASCSAAEAIWKAPAATSFVVYSIACLSAVCVRRQSLVIAGQSRLFCAFRSSLGRGLDPERLTSRYQGRDFRLTDVRGHVVKGILT